MFLVLRFKGFITILILFLLFTLSVFLYIIADMHMISNSLTTLTNENTELINNNYYSIDKTIKNIEKIYNYFDDPELPYKVKQLNTIEKHIDINSNEDLEKIIKIADSTPLDLATASIIVDYCKELNLPISLLLALIEQESNFNQYSLGKDMDRGYCQLIPATEKWLAINYGHLLGIEYDKNRIYEPEYNIGLGAIYLYILRNAYGDNYHKILSEYNRGVYNLEKYYNKYGTYSTAYSRSILNKQTKYRELN